jgi:endonuclease/exonuclease/phosphatase family metal-dependent hydrolase
VELVIASKSDVICLQEVSRTTAPVWAQELSDAGWPHTALGEPDGARPRDRRTLRVLTAARRPLDQHPIPDLPWPERALCTQIAGVEVTNVHSPISPSPGLAKVLTHEAVHLHLAQGSGPRVLCGDLNTPRREHPDGEVWTFARTRHGKLRPERGERWDHAELALIKGLGPYGFRDAFRELHGYESREPSWVWQRWGGGYRLDHLIVSREIAVRDVRYLHDWRDAGLSDHSPLLAHLGL